jgi:hypothetical protein
MVNLVFESIWLVVSLIVIYLIFRNIIKPYLTEKNRLLDIHYKNELYTLYASLSPEEIEKEIDKYILSYIENYYLYNIATRESKYINSNDIEDMKIKIISAVSIDLPDLYLFYIKCLKNISDDEDLISYIKSRTEICIMNFAVENNRTS